MFWNTRIHRLLSLSTAPEFESTTPQSAGLHWAQLWLQLGHRLNSLIRVPNKLLLILFSCLSPPEMVNNVNNRKQNVAKAKLSLHKLTEGKSTDEDRGSSGVNGGEAKRWPEICVSWNAAFSSALKWPLPGSCSALAGGNKRWFFSSTSCHTLGRLHSSLLE